MQDYVRFVNAGEDCRVTYPDGAEHHIRRCADYLEARLSYFGSVYRLRRFNLLTDEPNTSVYLTAVQFLRVIDLELENLMKGSGKMPDCVEPTHGLYCNRLINKF